MQRETTSREFLEWQEFMDKEEWKKHHHNDYYMAQIACEVARARVKEPGALSTEDFLIKFTTKEEIVVTEEVLEQRIQMSKAKWFGITGVGTVPGVDPAVLPTPPAPHTPGAKKVKAASNGGNNPGT